ncbi:HD domain-containing protein [Bradyrhizobium sp. Ai1a-2]|uniref:HD domain-containing protein n=1 Tax=Bradyrhizobium sp. Ai1a-2 TaxID=196490 RepID=UPI000419C2A3|nr:HD domain-containing protein [Bradyrhizobium sp. Ai1a-2]
MPDRFHYGRISDAVHGTFGISELESDIISTPVFQRLHNVRQLGLAHLVYPGADYSRFAHSLGACHIAGRMMRGINQNCDKQYSEDDVQMYRLAGLLHDLGHYPFSHAMEFAALDYYKQEAFLAPDDESTKEEGEPKESSQGANSDLPPPAYHHEPLGRAVLDYDVHIARVLKKHGIQSSDLKAVLSRENPSHLTNLVSSDLDCDRLDYLIRTAHCAGLPYGMVDIEYITSQMCVDSEGHLCLTKKAMRAADHLLISRYYDYTQLVFHKTVVAMELVLRDVIAQLLECKLLDCSGRAMKEMITKGEFASFDDQYMISKIRDAQRALKPEDPLFVKIGAVLNRRPPKLVASYEAIAPSEKSARTAHKNLAHQLREKMVQAAAHFGIPQELWHLWKTSLGLTKIGSRVPLSEAASDSFEEEASQSVRIMTTSSRDAASKSIPLVELDYAVMKQMSQSRYYAVRLFVHLPEDASSLRNEIRSYFQRELPDFPFSP